MFLSQSSSVAFEVTAKAERGSWFGSEHYYGYKMTQPTKLLPVTDKLAAKEVHEGHIATSPRTHFLPISLL